MVPESLNVWQAVKRLQRRPVLRRRLQTTTEVSPVRVLFASQNGGTFAYDSFPILQVSTVFSNSVTVWHSGRKLASWDMCAALCTSPLSVVVETVTSKVLCCFVLLCFDKQRQKIPPF